MIDLTIKTLDSQNHAFSVEDDITVAQFKERIAEVINIPVDTQRLIYCGRVLQDNKKLQEYDVSGKVVHLVQRAPPSATRRTRSPIPHQPVRRPFSTANAMYLGSMAFPSGLMEAQGIVPPPPTQSLSGSRLNVARRMIRRAENILNNLEDPQGTRTRESPPEEPQDDVTPVFAAQVFVPHSHDDPLASITAAVSAVENGILQTEQVAATGEAAATGEQDAAAASASPEAAAAVSATSTEVPQAEAATVTASASASSSTAESTTPQENGNGTASTAGGRLPENAFGTIEMSRLLDDLNKIHERLRPYMSRYHEFMRNDPAVNSEQVQDLRQTQTIINRVSEIMHLLGHAYHSLSDVMVQVSTPPPRPLLCRPILIQHSAVVQAGIPIQVEAQINLTSDRRPSDNAAPQSQPNQTPGDAQTGAATEGATTATTTNGTAPSAPQPTITTSQIRPNVHEIRIDSFPFEFRGFPRPPVFNITHQAPRPPPTGNNDNGTQATPTSGTETNTTGQQGQGPTEPVVAVVPPFVNNPNMEFFMEVTPESITIDSLETTVVTSAAQADNVLRGTFGSTPPEFIQSILQAVAGQMMASPQPFTSPHPPSSTAPTESSEQASTAQAPSAANGSNVNSQARGNTQTHPTTATQTRSTSRPHVHLAQHTMQGFDPFLPCNSHHIRRRRVPATATASVSTASTAAPPTGNQNATPTEGNGETQNNNQFPNPLYNILQGWFRTLGNVPNRAQQQQPRSESQENNTTTPANTTESSASPQSQGEPGQFPLPSYMDIADLSRLLFDQSSSGQATLDTFLQHFPEHHYTEGESLFTDLVITMARGLTFGDVIALNTGHIDPLVRIRPQLRTFFRNRVLNGDCPTQTAIDRGSDRLIQELQPILELMNTMRVRDNIDIVESATLLCRNRFPNIISLLMSRMTGSLRSLVDQCLLTVRQLCALALHSCADGQEGVEEVFRALIARYTAGISPEIHQWTISTSLSQLRHFLRTLDVSSAAIQPFIVVRTPRNESSNTSSEPEAMEIEESPEVETPVETATVPTLNSALDPEPLPNVVIGSEPWHRAISAEWIPIITRDTQRQRRQNPQTPFSDAYLSGMPSKRRKIVAASKPHGNLSQVISDGVRRAVQSSGVSNSVSLDVVSQAASSNESLQSAYREQLRTSVQSGLVDNPEFTPERFPNVANYFIVNKKDDKV